MARSLLIENIEESAPEESGGTISFNLPTTLLVESKRPSIGDLFLGGDLKWTEPGWFVSFGRSNGTMKPESFSPSEDLCRGDVSGGA